jgi:hypothetical protein
MDPKNTITSFLIDATGGNAGGRHKLTLEKKSFIPSGAAKALREQWNAAGRDNASIFLRLTEADGSNPHHVTGWDGKDTFVCFTESGLSYVPFRRLQNMKIDEKWDPKTRLIHVRQPVARQNMEQTTVDALLAKARGVKIESKDSKKKSESKSPLAFVSQKPNKEVPEDPPGRNKYEWRNLSESGKVKRRNLHHIMMKGHDSATKPGAHGETNQNVTTRQEALDAQLDKRQQVDLDSEGGKQSGEGKGEANKSDAQMDKRQQIDIRHEACDAGCGYKGEMRSYSGDSVKCPECGARQHVDVRTEDKEKAGKDFGHPESMCETRHPGKSHAEWLKTRANLNVNSKTEAAAFDHPGADCKTFHPGKTHKVWMDRRWNLNSRGSKEETPLGESKIDEKSKKLFGGKKAAPFGAKKPLVMMMLIKKGKGKKGAKMDEAVDTSRQNIMCSGCGARHGNPMGPLTHVKACPRCEARRQATGGGLKMSVKKMESLERSSLNLVHEEGEHSNWIAQHAHKFAANIAKMKSGHPSFRRRKKDNRGMNVSVMQDRSEPPGGEAHPHKVEPAAHQGHLAADSHPQHAHRS